MSKITGKVNYKEVLKGDTGYTFEPHVTVDGILYWTNNGNLENPLPVNLHGKQGFVFIPHVDSEGNLSWSNTGELENPPTVNIKGDKGYFYTPHISEDGILTWSNNGNLENPQPFNISDLILNEVKESRVDTTGKTFSKLKERLDSDFKKLSESIKNNDTKEEVVQARTATTGENFMSLDDRIDHEVMRLREKIEVTMLEQEGKESHDISNTVDGMSSNMIIKGETILNIIKTQTFGNAQICKYELKDGYYNITELTDPPNKGAFVYDLKLTVGLKASKEYTCIVYEKTKSNKYLIRDNKNSVNITSVISGNVFKFTPNKDTDFILLYYYDIVVGDKIKENQNILILEGDWTNREIPNFFDGVKSFGRDENKISILSRNKNLFIGYNKKIDLEKGKTYVFSSVKSDGAKRLYIKGVKEGDINSKFFYWNNAVGQYNYNNDTDILNNVTINCINKCEIICQFSGAEYKNIQLEEGTQSISYEPYKCNKKDILLNKYNFDNGLNSINNVCDEINSIKNIAIKRIGKREYQEGDLLLENIITDKTNTYYVLEEPIETPLNENINLKTFNDKTYVNFENSINGISSFKVPVNTNKLINDLKFEKEDLKEKFNNLTNEFENFKTLMIQTLPHKEV